VSGAARDMVHRVLPPEPEAGALSALASGVMWTRMPMPGPLGHVNVFILDDGPSWTVVDCGPGLPSTAEAWDRLIAGPLAGRPIGRIIVTHGHGDHIGFAAPLARRFNLTVEMSRGEWQAAVVRFGSAALFEADHAAAYYAALGCDPEMVRSLLDSRRSASRHVVGLPPSFRRLAAGDRIEAGGECWRVSTGGGHSPEHVVLHAAEAGLLIAGDHLLGRITPFVGTDPYEPLGNPLADYFATLESFATLPETTLVLPGHGLPFVDAAARARDIRRHHDARLSDLLASPAEGTVLDFARRLFPRAAAGSHARFALSETAAHLNLLVATGAMRRHEGTPLRYGPA
jgi:glyoxylase-like metal-dependent hydrolase (beta-lactamase superfamily II)